jgi:polysaccharide deacetylase family protein (PEP-CTERM system associated)
MKILTFDIEDWWAYDFYKIGQKHDWLPRLDRYLEKILDLLDERSIQATFFILGKLAKSHPDVISRITSRGHHIGCHSFSHRFWRDVSPKEVTEDTRIALDIIENIIGKKVDTYRAPAFSITEENSWILNILAEYGIKYDCSIFPAIRSFGGFPSYKAKIPSVIEINKSTIKEFPTSPATIFGREIVYSGGGYFRMFPYLIIKSLTTHSEYTMTYFHLKDFDEKQLRIYSSFEGEGAFSRYMKNYYGLKNCFSKFCQYISDFNFISVAQADKIMNWEKQPRVSM